MGTEQQANTSGQDGASGAGGGAPPDGKPAQAFGTATRQPVFPAAQQQGTEGATQEQQQGAAQAGGGALPAKGRGPVTTAGIPDAALKVRLERRAEQERAVWLKELGAKTPEEAREKLAKLKTADQEAEKRRLAEMGEVERLKAELDAERQRSAALEERIAEYEQAREHEQHEQVIGRVATELVDADAMPLFKMHLAQHVKKLAQTNPELAEKFTERGIRRFAEKWTKDHPKFARTAPPAATTQEKPAAAPQGARPTAPAPKPGAPAPVRRPVTTGVPQRRNPAPPVVTQPGTPPGMGGKTPRPGLPNSMTPAETKEFARRNGINYQPI